MAQSAHCLLFVIVAVVVGYAWFCWSASAFHDRPRCPTKAQTLGAPEFFGDDGNEEEFFNEEGEPGEDRQPRPPPPVIAAPVIPDVQTALNLSDVLIDDEQREAVRQAAENKAQIQSVNERFNAARRRVTENKLKPGIYKTQERRKLVDALLRRPNCSRKVRAWRTENSDTLRGDVIPKNVSSWGLMRAGRTNPEIDLHPGSMGIMSGMQGQWLSEELVPDDLVADEFVD